MRRISSPIFAIFLIFITHTCRLHAVDPPPWYVLQGSTQQQSIYIKGVSAESERLRGQVAQRRFEEKRHFMRQVATGLNGQLQRQKEILAGDVSRAQHGSTTPENEPGLPASNLLTTRRVGGFLMIMILLAGMYRFRRLFFGCHPMESQRQRVLSDSI